MKTYTGTSVRRYHIYKAEKIHPKLSVKERAAEMMNTERRLFAIIFFRSGRLPDYFVVFLSARSAEVTKNRPKSFNFIACSF